jgi:DNA topoisomerase-1
MTKTLVIVESPSKAKTINKYLGKDYVVEATVGHITNLPSNKINVDIEHGYKPTYEVIKGKEKVIKQIKSLAKQSKDILIATDPDREGEAIAADVYDYVNSKDKNIKRVLFNEITKSGIESALKDPKEIDWNLVESQTARRVMDRILGYKVSPFLWKTFYFGLSAGRVQSVAVKLICEREEEIGKFKPKEYWSIEGIFSKISGSTKPFKAKLYKINDNIIKYNGEKPKIENIDEAHKIVELLKGNKFVISDIQTKRVQRKPQAPFTTSSLQQAASTRLGYSPKRTMVIAQKLYEGVEIKKGEGNIGLITYMRTDSTRISNEALKQVRDYIGKSFGKDYIPKTANLYGKKVLNAQEAHEAIRPTDVNITPDMVKKLDKNTAAIYKLIWERFVASQMENAQLDQKTVLLEAKNISIQNDVYVFKATGSEIIFDGFLKVYLDVKEDDAKDEEDLSIIPQGLETGDKLNALNIDKYQHFTNPPPRYTESSLIKQLESLGIGRPSTFALIVSTVIDRKYVDVLERRLYATKLGIAVNKILMEHFSDVINYKFTANMEEELDTIANGKSTYKKVLDDFYIPFEKDYLVADSKAKDIKANLIEKTDILCPECGAETGAKMLKKWGRNGLFLTCERYPKCKGSMSVEDEGTKQELPQQEIICDKCGAPMAIKISKYGKFYGCTNYPKCKNTKPITLGISCPKCGKGEIVPRMNGRSKRRFYGCTNYPECDFLTNFEPVIQACTKCGNNFLEKKKDKEGTEFLQCPKCKEKYKIKEKVE